MPRSFTREELTETITLGQWQAMSPEDQLAFDVALTALWLANTSTADALAAAADRAEGNTYW